MSSKSSLFSFVSSPFTSLVDSAASVMTSSNSARTISAIVAINFFSTLALWLPSSIRLFIGLAPRIKLPKIIISQHDDVEVDLEMGLESEPLLATMAEPEKETLPPFTRTTIAGACSCGSITFTISKPDTAAPEAPIPIPKTELCSCEPCQRETGSPHSCIITVPRRHVKWEDPKNVFKVWNEPGSWGIERKFCGECGASLMHYAAVCPDIEWIKVGALERDVKLRLGMPEREVFAKNRLPYSTEQVSGPSHWTLPPQ